MSGTYPEGSTDKSEANETDEESKEIPSFSTRVRENMVLNQYRVLKTWPESFEEKEAALLQRMVILQFFLLLFKVKLGSNFLMVAIKKLKLGAKSKSSKFQPTPSQLYFSKPSEESWEHP